MKSILIYGGTFNPPHFGHIKTASAVQHHFGYDEVYFLPCKQPVLKSECEVTPNNRADMVRLAIAPHKHFRIDLREIKRDTPSYMVDTLKDIRDSLGNNVSITLLIGTDALLTLPQWEQWEELITYCNILVIKRNIPNGETVSDPLKTFINQQITTNKNELTTKPFGCFFFFNAGEYDVSSSSIREKIKTHQSTDSLLLGSVQKYIKEHHLYQD
jgi:nicotinate-nucleotide adenylyltransferase